MRNAPAARDDGIAMRSPADRARARGPVVGGLVVLVALGIGQLAAAFGTPAAAPPVAIGQAAIDASPQALKSWAIRTFGAADKTVLVGGILAVLLVLALALGPVAVRRPGIGMLVVAAASGLGVACAVSRPDASAGWAVPSILAGFAGIVALRVLVPTPVADRAGSVAERAVAFDRRRFLRAAVAVGAVGVGSTVVGVRRSRDRGAIEAARAAVRIPTASPARTTPAGARLDVPGLPPFVTPNDRFYRVDTALFVPEVDVRAWRLAVRGSVDRQLSFSFDELLERPVIERDITLNCVSNEVGGPYVGNARWTGVPLAPILREAGVRASADQLVSHSIDGFTAGTPMRLVLDGRDAMLAVAMNGEPLPMEHGFPVRMLVPGLYGYESATKWLVELEATTYAAYDPYWVQRGWARLAPIKTQSRIDTPRSGSNRSAGPVIVAGVAWAQHTGISRVEVRVDDGPWNDATLAEQDTVDTWRQWMWTWDATAGDHVVTVRATDADGVLQTPTPAAPFPNGASGWHRIAVTIR